VREQSRPDTPSGSWRRIEWTYDALGRRIQQVTSIWTNNAWFVVENLKFVSDPMLFGRHIVELNATNNAVVRSYVWGLDLSRTMDGAGGVGGLAWVTLHTASGSASGTHFVCYDGNGNIVALVSATTGDVTARYEYGSFGEPIHVTGPAASLNPFRFSTKRTENNTDLVLYEYRAYNPNLGRWLSRDPIEEQNEKNLYCGLRNASNNFIDVLGLKQCIGVGAQSFGIGEQGNIGPIGYLIAWRGSFAYQRCSTCCGKVDDIIDINASFQASFTGSSGYAEVALGVDWGAMVRYGILVRGGVEAAAGARIESDRCHGKGLTGKICLSGKCSLGIGGGAVATVTVVGLVQQFGADLMGSAYVTITRCYECENDHCEWSKIKICGGAEATATFYMFMARASVTIWKGEVCYEL
jgi:RHS repeat-associated protein